MIKHAKECNSVDKNKQCFFLYRYIFKHVYTYSDHTYVGVLKDLQEWNNTKSIFVIYSRRHHSTEKDLVITIKFLPMTLVLSTPGLGFSQSFLSLSGL